MNAAVRVLDNLPAASAVGVFSKPETYRALIRFSNGMGAVKDDREGDARGCALKLLGVPGAKILEDERDAKTQDFVMINHPVFFIRFRIRRGNGCVAPVLSQAPVGISPERDSYPPGTIADFLGTPGFE